MASQNGPSLAGKAVRGGRDGVRPSLKPLQLLQP